MTDRDLLTRRLQAIKADPDKTAVLLERWPGGKISEATERQLALMDAAMTAAEGGPNNIPFDAYPDPTGEPFPVPVEVITPEPPDEGGPADPAELENIKAIIATLDDANAAFVEQIARWCNEMGHYIGFINHPTRRRAEIAKALIHLSSMSVADAFDLIATVTGCDDHAEVGDVVGTLSTAHALVLQMADTTKGETE